MKINQILSKYMELPCLVFKVWGKITPFYQQVENQVEAARKDDRSANPTGDTK